MRLRAPFWVFAALALANLGQAHYQRAILPPRIASHFDIAGRADGWMRRDVFIDLYAGLVLLLFAMIQVAAQAPFRTLDAKINLPHKAYWLAPERRAKSLGYVSDFLEWFGAATMVLLLDMFRQIFEVNVGQAATLEHPVPSIVCYAGVSVSMTVALYRRFARLPG